MANQTHIPASPACGQWETLLADALDGHLRPEDESFFTSHMSTCPACSVLFEEAKRGREWLDYLSTEPEIPSGLLDRILAATGPGFQSGFESRQAVGFGLLPNQMQPALAGGVVAMPQPWQKPGFMGFIRRFAEPRLMMTAAMAFFSIALTLNLAGVKLSNLRLANLRPHAVRSYMERQFAVASTPLIRYYDHLRFVYEVQTRMRELRESTENDQTQQPPAGGGQSQHTPNQKNGGSRVEPQTAAPQESAKPAYDDTDFLESSLQLQNGPTHFGETHSGDFGKAEERSTEWIA